MLYRLSYALGGWSGDRGNAAGGQPRTPATISRSDIAEASALALGSRSTPPRTRPHDARSPPALPRRARAQGVVALDLDDPQREPPAGERGRPESRRSPGLLGLARDDHDGP